MHQKRSNSRLHQEQKWKEFKSIFFNEVDEEASSHRESEEDVPQREMKHVDMKHSENRSISPLASSNRTRHRITESTRETSRSNHHENISHIPQTHVFKRHKPAMYYKQEQPDDVAVSPRKPKTPKSHHTVNSLNSSSKREHSSGFSRSPTNLQTSSSHQFSHREPNSHDKFSRVNTSSVQKNHISTPPQEEYTEVEIPGLARRLKLNVNGSVVVRRSDSVWKTLRQEWGMEPDPEPQEDRATSPVREKSSLSAPKSPYSHKRHGTTSSSPRSRSHHHHDSSQPLKSSPLYVRQPSRVSPSPKRSHARGNVLTPSNLLKEKVKEKLRQVTPISTSANAQYLTARSAIHSPPPSPATQSYNAPISPASPQRDISPRENGSRSRDAPPVFDPSTLSFHHKTTPPKPSVKSLEKGDRTVSRHDTPTLPVTPDSNGQEVDAMEPESQPVRAKRKKHSAAFSAHSIALSNPFPSLEARQKRKQTVGDTLLGDQNTNDGDPNIKSTFSSLQKYTTESSFKNMKSEYSRPFTRFQSREDNSPPEKKDARRPFPSSALRSPNEGSPPRKHVTLQSISSDTSEEDEVSQSTSRKRNDSTHSSDEDAPEGNSTPRSLFDSGRKPQNMKNIHSSQVSFHRSKEELQKIIQELQNEAYSLRKKNSLLEIQETRTANKLQHTESLLKKERQKVRQLSHDIEHLRREILILEEENRALGIKDITPKKGTFRDYQVLSDDSASESSPSRSRKVSIASSIEVDDSSQSPSSGPISSLREEANASSPVTPSSDAQQELSPEEKRSKRRTHCLKEILATEQNYVQSLHNLTEYYMTPIREQRMLSETNWKLIFDHIPTIISINSEFLEQMEHLFEKHLESNHDELVRCLSRLVISFEPRFKAYDRYICNYKVANSTLERCSTNVLEEFFTQTANKLMEMGVRSTNINGFLVQPIQRIPRYRMMLQELSKYVDPENEELNDILAAAVTASDNIAVYCNSKQKEADIRDETLSLLTELDLLSDYTPDDTTIIYESPCAISCEVSGKKLPCKLYLFDGFLVASSIKKKKQNIVISFNDPSLTVTDRSEKLTRFNFSDENGKESSLLLKFKPQDSDLAEKLNGLIVDQIQKHCQDVNTIRSSMRNISEISQLSIPRSNTVFTAPSKLATHLGLRTPQSPVGNSSSSSLDQSSIGSNVAAQNNNSKMQNASGADEGVTSAKEQQQQSLSPEPQDSPTHQSQEEPSHGLEYQNLLNMATPNPFFVYQMAQRSRIKQL